MNGSKTTPNGHAKLEKRVRIASPPPSAATPEKSIRSTPPIKSGPSLGEIYSKSLPVAVYPLPAFIPHNPLSIIRIAWVALSHYLYPPTSHATKYYGYWSSATHSVHITDPKHIRALWEQGFFGKGNLSRSEPTWLAQERRRLGLDATETSEELTARRRQERDMLKRERAKAEQAAVEEQRLKEANGHVIASPHPKLSNPTGPNAPQPYSLTNLRKEKAKAEADLQQSSPPKPELSIASIEVPEPDNQEHLQLSSEEAFFLTYCLGILVVLDEKQRPIDTPSLFELCRQNSYFPPLAAEKLSPDDPFLVHYVVYHHFRSLGWVVRDGIKFSVDYLLYERGPVFKHSAFSVAIVPSYTDQYWQEQNNQTSIQKRKSARDWTWLHCINRVQSHVIKTLVLVYVDIPPPSKIQSHNIGATLRSYKIREFSISRWSANRNR
jgi:tRNA-splicing endonuclease subunit Sen2